MTVRKAVTGCICNAHADAYAELREGQSGCLPVHAAVLFALLTLMTADDTWGRLMTGRCQMMTGRSRMASRTASKVTNKSESEVAVILEDTRRLLSETDSKVDSKVTNKIRFAIAHKETQ